MLSLFLFVSWLLLVIVLPAVTTSFVLQPSSRPSKRVESPLSSSSSSSSSSGDNRHPQQRPKRKLPTTSASRKQHIVSLGKEGRWKEMLVLFVQQHSDFTFANYATTMAQLGKLSTVVDLEHIYFVKFIERLAVQMSSSNQWNQDSKATCHIVHAICKLNLLQNPQTAASVQHILAIVNQHATTLIDDSNNASPHDITSVCWDMAKSRVVDDTRFVKKAEQQSRTLLQNGASPQDAANLAWACSSLRIPAPNLLPALEEDPEWLLLGDGTSVRAIGNVAWACASLRYKSPNAFAEMDKHASWIAHQAKPQDVANIAWAAAILGHTTPNLFAEMETNRSSWLVQNGSPQSVSNAIWAFSRMGLVCANLVSQIEKCAERLVIKGRPRAIANLVQACATMNLACPQLFQAIENNADLLVPRMTPQDTATTLQACSQMGLYAPNLLKNINHQSKRLVGATTTDAACDVALAFATLGFSGDGLFWDTFATKILPDLLLEQDVSKMIQACYALALADFHREYETEFRRLWNGMIETMMEPQTISATTHAALLFESYAFCRADGVVISKPPIPLEDGDEMKTDGPTEPSTSFWKENESVSPSLECKKELSTIMEKLGWDHSVHVSPWIILSSDDNLSLPASSFAIDTADPNTQKAIEYAGPWCFLREVGTGKVLQKIENGRTKAKRRFLERLGWKVTHITYWNMDTLREKVSNKETCS